MRRHLTHGWRRCPICAWLAERDWDEAIREDLERVGLTQW